MSCCQPHISCCCTHKACCCSHMPCCCAHEPRGGHHMSCCWPHQACCCARMLRGGHHKACCNAHIVILRRSKHAAGSLQRIRLKTEHRSTEEPVYRTTVFSPPQTPRLRDSVRASLLTPRPWRTWRGTWAAASVQWSYPSANLSIGEF